MKNLFRRLREYRLSKNKAVVLYGIFSKRDPGFSGFATNAHPTPAQLLQQYQPVTVAPTKKDAMRAIDKLIYFDYFDHFSLWCDSHGYQDTCAWVYPSWDQYKRDVIGLQSFKEEAAKYSVFALTYSRGDMASIIRIFTHCRPLFLSYEKSQELQTYALSNPLIIPQLSEVIQKDVVDGVKIKAFLEEFTNQDEK